ncbi:MAG: GNAT family N-acetyltransferase [Parachlamydiaceae bacterium]|nr:GNAT family N-acetyltransferase [Parachlamydiaceae bacterium]
MIQKQVLPLLSTDILTKRNGLPEKPKSIEIAGKYVRLAPLVIERDAKSLFEVSNGSLITTNERSINTFDADELIWRYMFDGPFKTIADFKASLQPYVNATNGLCFCVYDKVSEMPVGVANFMNNSPIHLKIELGGIWYSPIAQRTQVNTEATYMMLKHCFDLGYRRLEWKCDARNERSRKAALRMGFKFEGIQESHMIMKDRNRDTAWYRILEAEWMDVKNKLELLLYK